MDDLRQGLYDKVRRRVGLLYEMFDERAFFWQPYILLRRTLYAVVEATQVSSVSTRFTAYALLGLISCLFHHFVHPFSDNRLNTIESISLFLLTGMSVIISTNNPPWEDGMNVCLFFFIVPFVVWGLFSILKENYHSLKEKVDRKRASTSADNVKAPKNGQSNVLSAGHDKRQLEAATEIQMEQLQVSKHTQFENFDKLKGTTDMASVQVQIEEETAIQENPLARLSMEQQKALPEEVRKSVV